MNLTKKKVVIVCKGLSGSGKSYFAEQMAKQLGNCVIVTKDDIRKQMGAIVGDDRTRVKENKVINRRNEIIVEALNKGQNIISADTNLSDKVDHIANIKALVFPKYRDQYQFEIKDFTDVPIEVCLERVAKRPEGVAFWSKIVRQQADQFLKPPVVEQDESLPRCVISDHDGTICHVSPNRSPYDGTHSHEDTKNEIVCEYLQLMKEKGYTIFILSGLEDKYKTQRENWLKANGVEYDYLYMRKSGDHRNDALIKNEIFEEHIKGKFFIHSILDDRNRMLRHWISLGYMNRLLTIGNPFHEF